MTEVGSTEISSLKEEKSRIKEFKEKALDKFVDINAPNTFIYITQVRNLNSILKNGILSESKGKTKDRRYKMRWKGHSDPDYVYVGKLKAGGKDEFENIEDFAMEILHPFECNDVAVLILDPSVEEGSKRTTWESERLIKGKIDPTKIIGIAVGGSVRPFTMDYIPERESIDDLTSNLVLNLQLMSKAKRIMERFSKKDSNRSLPIYDLNGRLLWPYWYDVEELRPQIDIKSN